MSSVKILLHNHPTLWSEILSCKLFNNCKLRKIRWLHKSEKLVHLPPPFKNNAPQTRCFFLFLKGGGRTLLSNSVATPLRGVAPSGSTARSDVREDFARAKPQGNPSPTTIYKNTDHCKRNGLFIFVNIKPAKADASYGAAVLHNHTGWCFTDDYSHSTH